MTRRTAAASALFLLLPAAAHAAFSYGSITYTDIADTFAGSSYRQFVSFPAINNAGQVAFSDLSQTIIQHVYLTPTVAGPLIDIADTAHGFSSMSSLTLNNTGVVVFSGTTNSGPNGNHNGIYTGSGAALSTVADSTTSNSPYLNGLTPRINDSGTVSYLGTNSGGYPAVTVRTGNIYTPVATYNSANFEGLNDSALNNSGQVAFNTDDYSPGSNNGAFVYRYTNGSLLTIGRSAAETSVAINDAGVVAYQAANFNGAQNLTLGIYASNGITSTAISTAGQNLPGTNILITSYAANNEGTPINSSGLVAIQASDNTLANYGIYVGDGTNTSTILHVGQSLFGKTVKDFGLGRDAINDAGQLTFDVYFSDGSSAIVRTSGVLAIPEPATFTLLALTIPFFSCSRRRNMQ
ncbi:MAG TPA: choice-of-anchor tandem repeat NxxGxxAF-containing protein [Tepidisphaeraceae bacterium]|nr:choice-of-anchor tandem repeat NxxGxxAF-containing protein [Tepidisphaeraceae bacterium]